MFINPTIRWSVGTVMTRENEIPSKSGSAMLALIPYWDLMNHTQGKERGELFSESGVNPSR